MAAAAEEPADEGYEQLVRQQLDALGYDSAAIPDDVLRAFLKDFDNKMEIQEESSATEAPGAPPVAASSDTTSVKTFGEPWATEATEEEPQVTRPASARPQGARRVGSAQSKTRLQGAPAAKRAAPARPVASSPAGRPRSAARPVARDRPATARDAGEAEVGSVNWAALRPSSAPPRPVASSSSFIRGNAGSTPRRAKCDPVALHARREAQWKSSSFLANSPRRAITVYSPAPVTHAANRRRQPLAAYEVPTSKRRDALVMETRQRLRYVDHDSLAPGTAGRSSTGRSLGLAPNKYVPPTEKRRDTLRWQVRSEMAWKS